MAQMHEVSLSFFASFLKKHLFGCVGSQHVGSSSVKQDLLLHCTNSVVVVHGFQSTGVL